jgi:Tol biopolymer transport system component
VPAAGGAVSPLTTLDASQSQISHRYPEFLPDSGRFLYRVESPKAESSGVWIGSLESPERTRLVSTDSRAAYADPGFLVYLLNGTLVAQPFSLRTLRTSGDPVLVAHGIAFERAVGLAAVSVAKGVLAYRAGQQGGRLSQIAWYDRAGRRVEALDLPPGNYANLDVSPDGDRMAVQRTDPGGGLADVWLVDLARGAPSRFTFDPAWEQSPLWSPDGRDILFFSDRAGQGTLYRKSADGSGEDERLLQSNVRDYPDGWSPDGRFIVYESRDAQTGWDLYLLPRFGDRKPVPLLKTPFDERQAQFSPDGKWIAYTSTESGRTEVFVQPYPLTGKKARVSAAGGYAPRWRRDGRELFFVASDGALTSVPVATGPQTFRAGVPQRLFATALNRNANSSGESAPYAVSRDGQRFLIAADVVETNAAPITVVSNWPALLKK